MVTPGRRARPAHAHPRPERIRVLVAEFYKLVRQALAQLLAQDCAFHIVAEAEDADAALGALARFRPEVVVLASDLPPVGGPEAVRRVLACAPHVRILALGSEAGRSDEAEMRRAGAVGYVPKTATADELCEAVRAAYHWG